MDSGVTYNDIGSIKKYFKYFSSDYGDISLTNSEYKINSSVFIKQWCILYVSRFTYY